MKVTLVNMMVQMRLLKFFRDFDGSHKKFKTFSAQAAADKEH